MLLITTVCFFATEQKAYCQRQHTVTFGKFYRLLPGNHFSFLDVQDAGRLVVTGGSADVLTVGLDLGSGPRLGALLDVLADFEQNSGILSVGPSGIVNLRGGSLFDSFDTIGFDSGSVFNLYGHGFSINGSPPNAISTDEPYEVDQRDVSVTGFLSDGTPFSFLLVGNGNFYESGYVNALAGASIRLHLLIPEPSAAMLLAIPFLAAVCRRSVA